MAIRAVFFDVGETLIDETRHWSAWADEMGVPRFTFFAALGGVIARGQHHRKVFEVLDPTFDVAAAEARRRARGIRYEFRETDFYPDAIPCLTRLKRDGIVVGIAGNQPEGCENALSRAGVAADVLASSHAWGVEKPSAEFFHRIAASCGLPAREIAYVGDRVDNDISPARAAGLFPVWIRRGPWAFLNQEAIAKSDAGAIIDTLDELPGALAQDEAIRGV